MTKNNKMLRLALVLCILSLFVGAFAGATFARYVSGKQSEDSARVTKWGVVVSITHNKKSELSTAYTVNDGGSRGAGEISVASGGDLASEVAYPGMRDAEGLRIRVTGKPEVATKFDVNMTVSSDIFLVHSEGTYYPVVFTLTRTKNVNGDDDTVLGTGNLSDIQNALNRYVEDTEYEPNTNLETELTLTWEWIYSGGAETDALDTQLATLARGNNPDGLVEGTDWSGTLAYSIEFTVSQVTKK